MTSAMHDTPELSLGRWIKNARIDAKKSQAEVAIACGVSRQLVGRWERGDKDSAPDINQFRHLVRFLDADWLWKVAATSTGCYAQGFFDINTSVPTLSVVH